MENASLIPHQLFGDDGMIKDVGEIAVPIIASISKRTNSHRRMATISTGLIMNDFSISTKNMAAKRKIVEGLQGLCDCGLIGIDNLESYKLNDAFDVMLYYELQPFVKLYDQEFAVLGQCTSKDNIRLTMIYLYIIKHINDKTKLPTWVSVETISKEFELNEGTVRKYIKTLLEDLGILFRKGKKHTQNGFVHLYTRNITEYIHRHKPE